MTTSAIAGNLRFTAHERKILSPTDYSFSVSAMKSVRADRHRVYLALTVPEYVEAWFSAPDAIGGCTAVSASENLVAINWRTQYEEFRIFCSYQVCRRSKLVFTWQPRTLAEVTPSMVKIRLLGDFARTTVHVTHSGLALSNQQWHDKLWVFSLRNLSKLF